MKITEFETLTQAHSNANQGKRARRQCADSSAPGKTAKSDDSNEKGTRILQATAGAESSAARPNPAEARRAYQGKTLLTATRSVNCDTWQSGLNNNVLVLGCSGGGKTRNHIKPNLLQCQGSYIVLDSKGALYHEVGPFLRENGYQVDRIDFNAMDGTVGYNPLAAIRWRGGRPLQQDIIAVASAICPVDDHESDPFWPMAAANYLTAYIAYVLEAMPEESRTMSSVLRVFEKAAAYKAGRLFDALEEDDPDAFAPKLYRRANVTCGAEKMHSSILGIIAAELLPFGFEGAIASSSHPRQIDFRSFGREKRALFVTIDDMDRSLDKLTSLFISQAFSTLCDSADHDCPERRLPVPVRFILDDFANLHLPHIDDVLAVIRSREISCTVVCQTVSQLEARYGEATANSIIGNCDSQLVLAFQDERTASYYACRANKTASTLLETPAGMWWAFVRGQRGAMEPAYRLENHPRYADLKAAHVRAQRERELERERRAAENARYWQELEEEFDCVFEEMPIEEKARDVA